MGWSMSPPAHPTFCQSLSSALSSVTLVTHESLPLHRRLPLLQELEPLAFVEHDEQVLADRHRPRLVADQLAHPFHCRLAGDVVTQRIEIGLVGDDLLPALRKQIIE